MRHPDTSRLAYLTFSAATALLFAACSTAGTDAPAEHHDHSEAVGESQDALTAAQCSYYTVNGKVQICHRTGSATHPYSILKISQTACVNAHVLHAGDYVAVNDPDCQGDGCLPEGAPCDTTLPCCEGFSCTGGTCTPNVSDNCSPSPCQNGSTCTSSASGYTCTCVPGYTGTNCETEIDECASDPCVHGQCLDAVNGYVCECEPGYAGTNCETNIDDCASNPCVHGTCVDGLNSFTCECDSGYSGTLCDTAASLCPCAGNSAWQSAMAGTIVTDGRCTNYSFPAPCGTGGGGSYSWAVTENGSSVVELLAGTQAGEDVISFCGVQVMNVSQEFAGNCSGGAFPAFLTGLSATEAAACAADVLALAAGQSVTCN
ncbi:calcium-binding EGF-like domain-containing protein [Sorangium sp. So ce726]|uniref:calcium-binding EGF-like domain-containing protein n=1 Tax=Sorangium sp. So ce726 TaxID=3133319 RepID=UPI003F5F3080